MSFVGTGSTGRLYFSSSNDKIVYYEMTGGNIAATAKTFAHGLENGYGSADVRGSAEVHDNGDGTLWITGHGIHPTRVGADGSIKETMPQLAGNATAQGSAMKTFAFGKKRYALVSTYKSGNVNGQMAIVDVTGGFNNDTPVATLPAAGLGSKGNEQRAQTVAVTLTDDNKVAHMFINTPLQGIAAYTYDGRTPDAVEEITMDSIDPNAPVEYYNLQGIKVNARSLIPGLYIRHQGSKSDKVLVK